MGRSARRITFVALVGVCSLAMSGVGDARWTLFDDRIAVVASPLQVCPDRITFTIAFDDGSPSAPGSSFSGFVVRANDQAGTAVLDPTSVVLPANGATASFDGEIEETRAFSRGFTFPWNQTLPVGHQVTVHLDETNSGDTNNFAGEVVPCPTDATADIDVRPGDPENNVNPTKKSTVAVAVLTTQAHPSFDATAVRRNSVRFGQVGTEAKPVRSRLKDVDGDGDTDLVVRFRQSKTGIGCGDDSANLRGKLPGGVTFDGTDYIRAVCS